MNVVKKRYSVFLNKNDIVLKKNETTNLQYSICDNIIPQPTGSCGECGQIESKVEILEYKVDNLQIDYSRILTDISNIQTDVSILRSDVDRNTSDIEDIKTELQNEKQSRITGDENSSTAINELERTLQTDIGTISARISTEEAVRASEDQALAQRIDTLQSNYENIGATISSEQVARADADSALASQISALAADIDNAHSRITNEQIVRSTETSALASSIETLSSTVDENSVQIQNMSYTYSGIFTEYTGGTPKIGQYKITTEYLPNGSPVDVVWQYVGSSAGENNDGWIRVDSATQNGYKGWIAGSSSILTSPDGKVTGWRYNDGSDVVSKFDILADAFSVISGYSKMTISDAGINFYDGIEQKITPKSISYGTILAGNKIIVLSSGKGRMPTGIPMKRTNWIGNNAIVEYISPPYVFVPGSQYDMYTEKYFIIDASIKTRSTYIDTSTLSTVSDPYGTAYQFTVTNHPAVVQGFISGNVSFYIAVRHNSTKRSVGYTLISYVYVIDSSGNAHKLIDRHTWFTHNIAGGIYVNIPFAGEVPNGDLYVTIRILPDGTSGIEFESSLWWNTTSDGLYEIAIFGLNIVSFDNYYNYSGLSKASDYSNNDFDRTIDFILVE